MTKRGFTIVEILIVTAIAGLMVSLVVTNFSRSRNDLSAAAPNVVGDIRRAQNLALAGSQHNGAYRCGYGVSFESDGYVIFAGPAADGTCGAADDRVYGPGDEVVERIAVRATLEFQTTGDIYFVPPLPFTYLNGDRQDDTPPLMISLVIKGATCPSNECRTITIDRAGRITTIPDAQ